MRGGALDVAGAADQRHDVTDIDAGVRAQGDFTSHSRQRSEEHASCGIADTIGHVLDGGPWSLRLSTRTSITLPGSAFRISSASISVPTIGFAATMAAVRPAMTMSSLT